MPEWTKYKWTHCFKFHIFWEGHKILQNCVDLSYVVMVKSAVKILQNFVAFSEYMNFNLKKHLNPRLCLEILPIIFN